MQQRIPSLRAVPVAFAHRGARAHAPENTLEAFALAVRLGANGLETDVWSSLDGAAIVDHDGIIRRRFRKHEISELASPDIPSTLPRLDDVLNATSSRFEWSIDVKNREGFEAIDTAVSRSHVPRHKIWLCHHDIDVLVDVSPMMRGFRMVHSTRLRHLKDSPERHGAYLSTHGVHAINMHHTEWTGGLVALFHRFGIECLAWDIQYPDRMRDILLMGLDGVFSDHVDMMVEVYQQVLGRLPMESN